MGSEKYECLDQELQRKSTGPNARLLPGGETPSSCVVDMNRGTALARPNAATEVVSVVHLLKEPAAASQGTATKELTDYDAAPKPGANGPEIEGKQLDTVNSKAQGTSAKLHRLRRPYTLRKRRESWSPEEHERFLRALAQYGRLWTQVQRVVKTKTAEQIRSHAQKYFIQLEKRRNKAEASGAALDWVGDRARAHTTSRSGDKIGTRRNTGQRLARTLNESRDTSKLMLLARHRTGRQTDALQYNSVVAGGSGLASALCPPYGGAIGSTQAETGYVASSTRDGERKALYASLGSMGVHRQYLCHATPVVAKRMSMDGDKAPCDRSPSQATREALTHASEESWRLPRIAVPLHLGYEGASMIDSRNDTLGTVYTHSHAGDEHTTIPSVSQHAGQGVMHMTTMNPFTPPTSMTLTNSQTATLPPLASDRQSIETETAFRNRLPKPIEPWGGTRQRIESLGSIELTPDYACSQRHLPMKPYSLPLGHRMGPLGYEHVEQTRQSPVPWQGALSPEKMAVHLQELPRHPMGLSDHLRATHLLNADATLTSPSKQVFIFGPAATGAWVPPISRSTPLPSVSVLLCEGTSSTPGGQSNYELCSQQ
ncbi:hypothetical protein F1559_003467 [Cyanidiococcus yangmingshanensis]|uniref:Uncharacterized protein n=1 Tax=Cyanidiococcus yangmingshanensis TaxID=2690220 RepID=A0A7J7IKU4_9RHOD|nr:hypothetical protein F1559_003467 [Cyanidiococcus yangmingshanensis]